MPSLTDQHRRLSAMAGRFIGRDNVAPFDGFGFVPPSFARGDWTPSGLVLIRTSPRGMARHSFRVVADGGLSIALENSFDAARRGRR
jgi:hypothetical protein